jgi:hypothetical protein
MPKSRKLTPDQLPCVVAVSAALLASGCGSTPRDVRRCVDDKGNVVSDSLCASGAAQYRCLDSKGNVVPDSYCANGTRGYSRSYYTPFWTYGGLMNGNRISGYSRTPRSGAEIVDSGGNWVGGTRRSGFGSSGGSSFSS